MDGTLNERTSRRTFIFPRESAEYAPIAVFQGEGRLTALKPHEILKAALGWFELGNYVEAFNELDNLLPEHRASIEAMELRCRIYKKLERWQDLEWVAVGCLGEDIKHLPFACYHGWALLKQRRPDEAKAALDRVPYTSAPELLFTRACVACALSKIDKARSLLSDAIAFSIDPDAMKLRALDEPELERVWRTME